MSEKKNRKNRSGGKNEKKKNYLSIMKSESELAERGYETSKITKYCLI